MGRDVKTSEGLCYYDSYLYEGTMGFSVTQNQFHSTLHCSRNHPVRRFLGAFFFTVFLLVPDRNQSTFTYVHLFLYEYVACYL